MSVCACVINIVLCARASAISLSQWASYCVGVSQISVTYRATGRRRRRCWARCRRSAPGPTAA